MKFKKIAWLILFILGIIADIVAAVVTVSKFGIIPLAGLLFIGLPLTLLCYMEYKEWEL